jgi:hypothetical protein
MLNVVFGSMPVKKFFAPLKVTNSDRLPKFSGKDPAIYMKIN